MGELTKSERRATFERRNSSTRTATPAGSEEAEADGQPAATAAADQGPTSVDVRSVALTVIAALAVILVLQYSQAVLIPIVIAVLISYVLAPLVESLSRVGLPRWAGAGLVIALLCGAAGLSTYTLAPQFLNIVEELPTATRRLMDRVQERRSKTGTADADALEKVQRAATEIDRAAAATAQPVPVPTGVQRVQIVERTFSATDYLWRGGRNVLGFLGQLTMVLFLVFFLLVTGDLFKRKLVKIAGPTLTKKKVTVQIMDEINGQISGFLRVQVFTSTLVAVLTGLALWGFGVQQYIVWGLLAGLFNSVPYLGAVAVTAGLGVVAFLQFDDLLKTAYVCGVALAITSLEGWLLTPMLLSRAARMNPVAIFVGLLFWSWVWGVWGTILAVPMMMMAKSICDRVEDLQPVGELLGE